MTDVGYFAFDWLVERMSALPPKADMDQHRRDVRFVPKADILRCGRPLLFDHFIGSAKQRKRNANAKRFRRLEV